MFPILERFAANTQLRSECILGESVFNSVQLKLLGEMFSISCQRVRIPLWP